jgi:hypothetical protein
MLGGGVNDIEQKDAFIIDGHHTRASGIVFEKL